METITETDYQQHMASIVAKGFTLDPPGYEQLSQWTHMLMHLVNAEANFKWLQEHQPDLGNINHVLQSQSFLVAGVMAYGRCYAQSGPGIPILDAKQVYKGSADGLAVHRRLIEIRNTLAAHTDKSDLVRVTLAVREEADRIVIQHLSTSLLPTNEIPDFLEAVEHTAYFVTIRLNKYLDHFEAQQGKTIHSIEFWCHLIMLNIV